MNVAIIIWYIVVRISANIKMKLEILVYVLELYIINVNIAEIFDADISNHWKSIF